MADGTIGLWTVPLAVFGGAIRVSTPFLFVSLGECITERSGRINLGLEGTLVMGAMSAYGISYLTGSPWLGVLAAGVTGALLGALHAGICSLPRVNDVAVGIALMLFGTGLAFYLGKPLIEPTAPRLPASDHGRRLSCRDRRLVPVAVLSRKLERRPLQRPGHHRRRAGDLRPMGPD